MKLSRNDWNKKHVNKGARWYVKEITRPLKTCIDQLTAKNIAVLVPIAGNSYEAEHLHRNGFANATVVDFASEPIQNIKGSIPDFPEQNFLQKDFFKVAGQFNLIIERTFFFALNMILKLVNAKHIIKPAGKLVGVIFEEERDNINPPFGGDRKEYLKYFDSLFEIDKMESCYNSIEPRRSRELRINLRKSRVKSMLCGLKA